jgi:competence protein ComEC
MLVALIVAQFRGHTTELAFLAVGQGDATLFATKRKAILFDTGPAGAGDRVVVPELRKRGIRQLDMVLLSHPDSDHIAALPEIVRRVRVVKVVVPNHFRGHPDLMRVLEEANLDVGQLAWIAGPSQAKVADFSLFLDVPPWQDGTPDNEGSLMAKIVSGSASVTLTGDAGFLEETEMMQKGSWSAQILKLGHHGSRYSSGDAWLDHVHPEFAIISCGRDNNYGHPAPEVIERCTQRGILTFRTDRQGTLSFGMREGKFQLN